MLLRLGAQDVTDSINPTLQMLENEKNIRNTPLQIKLKSHMPDSARQIRDHSQVSSNSETMNLYVLLLHNTSLIR